MFQCNDIFSLFYVEGDQREKARQYITAQKPEEVIDYLRQKPLDFYLNPYNNYPSLFEIAVNSYQTSLLKLFHIAFEGEFSLDSDCYDTCSGGLDKSVLSLYIKNSYYFADFFNLISDTAFLSRHNKIQSAYIDDPVAHKIIAYGFGNKLTSLLLFQFNQFSYFYDELFLLFLESTKDSYENFLYGLDFFNTNINVILEQVQNPYIRDLKKFKNKHYLKMIQKNPQVLTKISSNPEIVQHIFSLIENKEQYFHEMNNQRNRPSHFKLKEKGLYNSKAPLLYAAFTGNAQFINYIAEQGYIFNDSEKFFFKEHSIQHEIIGFEDNLFAEHVNALKTIESEEGKAHYLLKAEKDTLISKQDFKHFFLRLDFSQMKEDYYPLVHDQLAFNQVRDLYLDNKASITDVLIRSKDVSFLKNHNFTYNILQVNYLSEKLKKNLDDIIDVEFFSGKNKDYHEYFNFFTTNINSNYIYESYYNRLSDRYSFDIIEDILYSKYVNKEDLFKNHRVYLNQSLFMNAVYLQNGHSLSDNEEKHLYQLVHDLIPDINQFNLNRARDRFYFDYISESVLIIEEFIPEFSSNILKSLSKYTEIREEFLIMLNKNTLLKNMQNIHIINNKKTERL